MMMAEREKIKQQRVRNIVLRIKNRTTSVAVETWKSTVAEIKRHRVLLARAAAPWMDYSAMTL